MSVTEYLNLVSRLDRLQAELLLVKAVVEDVISTLEHDRKKAKHVSPTRVE